MRRDTKAAVPVTVTGVQEDAAPADETSTGIAGAGQE